MEMLKVILAAVLVNNCVLVQFLGICPFLGVSKKMDSAVGMSLAVTFVMALATAATWPPQWREMVQGFVSAFPSMAWLAVSKAQESTCFLAVRG